MALPRLPFVALCALLFCTVLTGVPFSSARAALMPDVLPGDKFVLGSAIGNITYQASQILGFVAGAPVVGRAGAVGAGGRRRCLPARRGYCVRAGAAPRHQGPCVRRGQSGLYAVQGLGILAGLTAATMLAMSGTHLRGRLIQARPNGPGIS